MLKIVKSLFAEDTNPDKLCIRRVMGAIGFLACIIALYHPAIDGTQFNTLLYVSTGLLGITTIDKIRTKKEVRKEEIKSD